MLVVNGRLAGRRVGAVNYTLRPEHGGLRRALLSNRIGIADNLGCASACLGRESH